MADDAIPGVGRRSDPIRVRKDVDYSRITLGGEEGFMLSRVAAGGSLASVIAGSGLPESRAASLLASLVEKGVIECGERRGAAREPTRYAGFIFNPADLAEAVELDLELRKEILFVAARLEGLSHYELLGVRPRMGPADIRKAYLEKSQRFHPDRYYGRQLGSFAPRLNAIFQRLTQAHQVLSDPKRKAEYDKITDVPLDEGELAQLAVAQARSTDDARRIQERRERVRRTSPFLAKREKVENYVREAHKAESLGDLRRAASLYQLALAVDEANPELLRRHRELDERACGQRAEERHDRAVAAETLGNYDEALRLLREASEADPKRARWQLALAAFLIRHGRSGDAQEPARRAVGLEPRNAAAWTLQGQVLLAAGEKKLAKEAFQRAADLDPTADEAKEALKRLRWSLF